MEIIKSYWHSDGDRISLSVPFFKVDEERRIVSGFATLDNVDRHRDIVDADASMKAFETFRGNLREMHQPIAVGKVTNFREEQFYDNVTGETYRGVFVDTYVSKGAQDTWEKVLDGTLSGFSIGGNITKVDSVQKGDDMIRVIKEYELVELSLVDSPANQLANIFAVQKSDNGNSLVGIAADLKMDNVFWCNTDQIAVAKDTDSSVCLVCDQDMTNIGWVESNDVAKNEEIGKAVDRHLKKAGPHMSGLLPLADRERPWDGSAAEMNARRWASSDGSGDRETINWNRYSNAFAWHDHENMENFTSYKLGFADVIDGRLVAIPRGIFAAAAAVEGARGGVDIPESDMSSVKSLLSRYYEKMRSQFNDDSIEDPFTNSMHGRDEQDDDEDDDKDDDDIYKAEPGSVKVGDFVSWNSSGGRARGRIEHIMREGTLGIPGSSFEIEATPENPAALIRIWRKAGNGWEETETLVGHKLSTLTRIDKLPEPTDKVAKQADDQNTFEGGAVSMEIEKNEENAPAEEVVESVNELEKSVETDGCSCEKSEDGAECCSEETQEVVEKAADISEVEVEEPDFAKMLDDLKDYLGENISKSAEDTKTTVDELNKTLDARITELAEKHDNLSKAVENIKSAIDTIEKRVDMVESETAVKKSSDLDGSKEEKTIRKGIWSGSFLAIRDN